MRHFSHNAAVASTLLCLSACSGMGTQPQDAVIVRYQHVANVHQVRFASPVTLAPSSDPVRFVMPLDPDGFWAIFVVCSLNVTGSPQARFHYDADQFEVEYGAHSFGRLQPYTLRLQDTADLNTPADTGSLVNAVAAEIQEGPSARWFARGYYPSLNYRIAVYMPKALPGYAGEQLALRYPGAHAILIGNGHPPSDIGAAGGSGAGIASRCLP